MPVVILVITSLLVVIAVVVPLIAAALESREQRHKRDLAPAEPPLLWISEAFDPVYSVLWQSPIAALELIAAGGASGIPAATLRPIYEQAAVRFPEIYEGSGFVPWLHVLEKTRLILWHGSNVVLTPEGRAFLRFQSVTDTMSEV